MAALTLALVFVGCTPAPESKKPSALLERQEEIDARSFFQAKAIGSDYEGDPWIAHVKAVDLDRDGQEDLLVCDARDDEVLWLRKTDAGEFEEIVLATEMRAPVHAEEADMDGDGDLDILVSSMSIVFPSNEKIGAVILLDNDGNHQFTKHVLLDNVDRVVDVRPADFNGDGQLDLAVGQFGYDEGMVRWMERVGPMEFKSHILLNLSGTVNVCVADFDGNGALDFAAFVTQQWEEIHMFFNDGRGNFTARTVFGSTNQDFAGSGMSLCDLNQDGLPDLVFSNGDGFGPTTNPGPRPWHGVQWLRNKGKGQFQFARIGDLPGAYAPLETDLDGDGEMDVVALSSFNDFDKPDAVSMVWFRNMGGETFKPHVLAYKPTHLLTIAVIQEEGRGTPSLVTGAFHGWPPFGENSRLTLWRPTGRISW